MKAGKPRVSSYATPGEGNSTLISIVTIFTLLGLWWLAGWL